MQFECIQVFGISQESLLILLFIFHVLYVLFNEHPSFIWGDFIFYSKVALRPILHVAKMLMAKAPRGQPGRGVAASL